MSTQTRSRTVDHGRVAKLGFLAGVGLFLLGAVGEVVVHAFAVGLAETLDQLFLGMEVGGILIALFVPIVFGAVLPLIE